MNREDFLKRFREEGEGNDPYEAEIARLGWRIGARVALAAAFAIFILELVFFGEYNFAVYAVCVIPIAVSSLIRALKLKNTFDVILAIVYSVALVGSIILYVFAFVYGMV